MQATKSQLRSRILAARRRLDAAEREREARDLARHAAALARPGETVCGYVPVGSEPGSLALIDVLVDRVSRREGRPLLKDRDPRTVLTDLAAVRNPVYALAPIHVKSIAAPHDITVDRIMEHLTAWQ